MAASTRDKARDADQTVQVDGGMRSINDNWFNRFLVLAAIKLLRRIRPKQGRILLLTPNICVKYGRLRHLPEASTMDFIRRNTRIPVPRIYCAFKRRDQTYIVMERVKGEMLGQGWKSRSPESRTKILEQLKGMIERMRRLPAPSAAVASVDGGPLWDCRLPGTTLYFGPFHDIDAFHKHLRRNLTAVADTCPEDVKADFNELMQLHSREWGDPVFTHGDLSSLNIMAQGDTITGIIDWETAGWYPYYWEYTTACQVNFRNLFWRDEIEKFLEPYPTELRQEQLRQRWFGDT